MSATAAKGFLASGVACGMRRNGRLDVAVLRSSVPATGTALFTTNRMQAAPVLVSREHLVAAEPQAVVVNAGVANAGTGARGLADARATARRAARALGVSPEQVLLLSTGVIGPRLPMDRLLPGVDAATAALRIDGGNDAAEAILTTDTRTKQSCAGGDGFTVGGMAKGSGMIHPHLATMLAVLTTDYPLDPGEAPTFLRPAVERSFNSISVDGECSTNDTVVLLANGESGIGRTEDTDEEFAEALGEVCGTLASEIVADGEGATVVAEIAVAGATTQEEASAIVRRIATSPLVKTALFGRDPNWGRVLAAAGSAPFNGGFARIDPERVSLRFNGTTVLQGGEPRDARPELSGPTCRIELDLDLGCGGATYLTSDLSYDYVRINAEYRT